MGMAVDGAGRGTLSEVNVVPLIDILLVLLVIFLLLAPLKPVGFPALLPQPANSLVEPPRREVLILELLADGAPRLNQQPVAWEELGSRLNEIVRLRGGGAAFLRGEKTVKFSQVARALDIMRSAGVDSVVLLTPELERQP